MAEAKKPAQSSHETIIYQLAVLKAMSGKAAVLAAQEKEVALKSHQATQQVAKLANAEKSTASKVKTPPESMTENRLLKIQEIAQLSGLNDEKETQRYLFILEGQKLVTPSPEGDLTSKTWAITHHGLRAVEHFERGA